MFLPPSHPPPCTIAGSAANKRQWFFFLLFSLSLSLFFSVFRFSSLLVVYTRVYCMRIVFYPHHRGRRYAISSQKTKPTHKNFITVRDFRLFRVSEYRHYSIYFCFVLINIFFFFYYHYSSFVEKYRINIIIFNLSTSYPHSPLQSPPPKGGLCSVIIVFFFFFSPQ